MNQSLWQKTVRVDAYTKDLGLCNRHEERVCAEEGEGVSIVEERERRSKSVHIRTTKERIYLTLKITSNGTSILCRKEGWYRTIGI